ncbi:MAG: metallophosphoesterase [Gammaproteobacteria bacterium]|nr:metallophosphoesterase [Gammaproteobacteria bacterium]
MTASIHILSDLHLEFEDFQPIVNDADIVLLSGDIHTGTQGLPWARLHFPESEIIYVAGNHEFYRHNYQMLIQQLRITAEKYQIHFLENDEVILKGIRFLGCTLWTDYKCSKGLTQEEAMVSIEYRLADHRMIEVIDEKEQGSYFSTRHAWRLHTDSVNWLTQKLFDESFDGKTVVVTHHGPSKLCEHKIFGYSDISGAFYSDLPNLIAQVELWVCGHSHSNLDVKINNTRLIANQKGYPNEAVADFNENLKIFI